jgi:hypothetical protein
MFVIATARYEAGSNPVVCLFWIGFAELVNSVASGCAFAMTMPDTAFEITSAYFQKRSNVFFYSVRFPCHFTG